MAAPVNPVQSAAGRKSRAVSPWNRGPAATSERAKLSYLTYCKRKKEPKK